MFKNYLTWPGMNPGTIVMSYRLSVDENFIKTFDMHLVAGRFFSKDFGGNDNGYVVNETALKVMGLNPRMLLAK